MRQMAFLLTVASILWGCSDQYISERREGLKWEKNKNERQTQEYPSWGTPDHEAEKKK